MTSTDLDTALTVDLASPDYYDRLYGCWQGKNAGGTLGTPLEEALGREEPFDVWWYPELQEGGLPNDDFEMQLVWLKAIEEVGPDLTARDLSRYWLDHIGYNFDEYGLSKLNLRLGLEPPVSGHHNNWFIDCMGSPIRSEIWACLTPGAPRLAARFAYNDAICDHAGGEGVEGELFNAALESSAFVVQDVRLLIDIALSYTSPGSQVRRAVTTALDAYDAGLTWQQARRAVLDATPHYNAQYSPINTGFQVIGLLYGREFGEAICITVNCGYDTDSSGAAIGSYLGIIHGSAHLPERWVAPLGAGISTNESWGGVRQLTDTDRPVPTDLRQLCERLRTAAGHVLARYGVTTDGEHVVRCTVADLYADESVAALHARSATTVPFPGTDIAVDVEYGPGPVCVPGVSRRVGTLLTNRRVDPVQVEATLLTPTGWTDPDAQSVTIAPGASPRLTWHVDIPDASLVEASNVAWLTLRPVGRPVPPAIPVVLVGATAARVSGTYGSGADPRTLLDTPFEVEVPGAVLTVDGRPGTWRTIHSDGHAQNIADAFSGPGVVYLQTYVLAPTARAARIVLDPSVPTRYWVNGVETGRNDVYRRIRPNQHAAPGVSALTQLVEGWNEILVKLVHDGTQPPPELHLAVTGADRLKAYQYDVTRTRFPWDLR